MPVYPTYFPQMNNGYNQQIQNPYQQRMDFLQSYQQSLQQPVQQIQMPQANQQLNVMGKIVDSVDAVKAIDIPMDGMMYYFPKADASEILGKQWLPNGQTRILSFKPILEADPNSLPREEEKLKFDLSEASTTAFMERFDELVGKIDRLERSMAKPINKTTVSKTKKESVDDE